jgi:transcriptional regulator with XRE-family HTH domain
MTAEKGFFARRLREVRHEKRLSQADLSGRSGVAVSTIRQFEYGRREPTYRTLVKLARGLGVSLSAFDAGQTAEPAPPQEEPKARRARKPRGG